MWTPVKILLLASYILSLSANAQDDTHNLISKEITGFASQIDSFFAEERSQHFVNKSQIRLFVDTEFRESTEPVSTPDMRIKLVLPRTQKRLQLIIESDKEEDKDDDQEIQSLSSSSDKKKDNTKAGIEYFLPNPKIKTSLGSGILFREITPLVFARLRMRKRIKYKSWLIKPEQELMWISSDGYSTKTSLDFDKRLNNEYLFRVANDIKWNDKEYDVDFRNGPSLYQKISKKIGLSYNFRVISSDAPVLAVNNYSFSVNYRQLLYKKWFFWTVSPALNFPRENNFHRTPGLTIRFEIIAGYVK